MDPYQKNNEVDKPAHSTAAIETKELHAGALSWLKKIPFLSFPGRLAQ